MSNRYYTEHSDRKISAPAKGVGYPGKGSKGSVREATASWGKLPGPAGKSRGNGVPKLKTYVKYAGC